MLLFVRVCKCEITLLLPLSEMHWHCPMCMLRCPYDILKLLRIIFKKQKNFVLYTLSINVYLYAILVLNNASQTVFDKIFCKSNNFSLQDFVNKGLSGFCFVNKLLKDKKR